MSEWHIEKSTGWEIGFRAIVDSDGVTVCNPSPMGEANARLIAAAPDLLAALQLIETDKDGDGFICREAMEQVRAAIDRAEGETV